MKQPVGIKTHNCGKTIICEYNSRNEFREHEFQEIPGANGSVVSAPPLSDTEIEV